MGMVLFLGISLAFASVVLWVTLRKTSLCGLYWDLLGLLPLLFLTRLSPILGHWILLQTNHSSFIHLATVFLVVLIILFVWAHL